MDITIGIPTTSSIVAVKMTAIDGLLTSLNPNLSVNDCFIATLSVGAGSAIFAEGASTTGRTVESGETEKAISAFTYGLPSGNYKIRTSTDTSNPTSWDTQTEVVRQNVINEDIVTLFLGALSSSVNGNLLRFDGTNGRVIEDSGVSIQTSGTTSFSDSDLKVITDKFIKTLLGSTAADKGASLIGVQDAGGLLSATNVEDAIAEIMGQIANTNFSLSGKTCTALSTYYSNQGIVRMATPPVQDSAGNSGVGRYVFQYVFKNAVVATPSTGIDWTTEALELSSGENAMNVPVPDPDDSVYSGGTAGYAYLYFRVRFENNAASPNNVTDWAYLSSGETIAEPETLDEALISGLTDDSDNAQKAINSIGAKLSNSPTFASLKESSQELISEGSSAPTTTPTNLSQVFYVTSGTDTGDIYRVTKSGTTLSWYLDYDASA